MRAKARCAKSARSCCWPMRLAEQVAKHAKMHAEARRAGRSRRADRCARIRSAGRAMISTCRFCPAITSPPIPAPASCTPRPATAKTISTAAGTTAIFTARSRRVHLVQRTVRFAANVPLFAGKRILTPEGKDGDANGAVIKELIGRGALLAKGTLRHQYPHSWRSKAPVIFRATPQWFAAIDKPFAGSNDATLARARDRRHRGHALVSAAPARTASARW